MAASYKKLFKLLNPYMSEAYNKGVFVMDYLKRIGFDFETIADAICDENLDKSYEIIIENPTISKYEFVEKNGN